jgi:hypothetical protein
MTTVIQTAVAHPPSRHSIAAPKNRPLIGTFLAVLQLNELAVHDLIALVVPVYAHEALEVADGVAALTDRVRLRYRA